MASAHFEPFLKKPKAAQWCILVVMSAILTVLLQMTQLPAALLLGPMIAGILLAACGGKVDLPLLPLFFAQAVIGCLIARVITLEIIISFINQWALFIGIIMAVIFASSLIGYIIGKLKILPDTTGVWGMLPGAAYVTMLLAEAYGADMRLVAFMQYLRVLLVAFAASVIARFWVSFSGTEAPYVWFPEMHWLPFGETLALVVIGVFLGLRSRIPAGVILVPLFVGAALQIEGLIQIELPPWFLALSYLLLGWSIGLRFTRQILAHAARALPQTFLSIVVLIAFCGLLAYLLVRELDIDPLTAYLATSPGGIDSIAIIAASSKVNMPFVMALQVVRLVFVILIGPPLSRWVAHLVKPSPSDP